ncbi:MAG TPA: transposase [Geobacteraceae bacterium]
MSRISRIVIPHYPHHITQRGVRFEPLFHDDGDRHAYLELIAEETARFGVEVLAWCLLSDHVHFVAVPQEEHSLARAFGEGHRRYTRRKNAMDGANGYLFRGRFASSVLDALHLGAAVRYVESHPIRSRTESPDDYPWSSARFHAGKTATDPLVKDRTLRGLIDRWEDFVSVNDEEAISRLRQATRTGRPTGDEQFVAKIASLTGRNLSRGLPGRPRKKP